MCGICGAFRLDGGPAPALPDGALERMAQLLEHRGPDDAGYVVGDGCSLAARRLSIIDVEGGHQPFANESGRVWAAQNGEIYNHVALRESLQQRGHQLRSRCDTEVLPHLYEEHGTAMVDHVRGMFAFAVWDRDRRRGVLVRDRLGIKPLYWARRGDVVLFSSELKSLLASGLVEPELDGEAVAAYLALGYIPEPMTPLRGVHKLRPGERLVVADGEIRLEQWWTYPTPDAEEGRSAGEWAEEVREALRRSVRERLMSDVPLGAMLSGGLDSSLIVALMAEAMDRPVDTFSVGFADGPSELDDARRVAARLGATHHELEVSTAPDVATLERLAWHLDEPLADLSSLGFLALCELARQRVTVALSGQGADELFGGYRKHRVASLAESWQRLPGGLRAGVAAVGRQGPGRAGRMMEALQAPDAATRLLASSTLIQPELRGQLFAGAMAEHARAAERVLDGRLDPARGAQPLGAALYLDGRLGLVDDMLSYFDRCSMAHSLEVRVPFLDHRLVELAARIPTRHKVRRLQGKHVLRLAAEPLVPAFVLEKPKRGFFNEAVAPWLRACGTDLLDDVLLAPDARIGAVVDGAGIAGAASAWRGGDDRHAPLLLAMVMLELWLSRTLPRASASATSAVAA